MNRNGEGRKRAERLARVHRARGWRGVNWGAWVRRHRRCRVPCSCPMCGNPRHHFGEHTAQERRADEAAVFQLRKAGIR